MSNVLFSLISSMKEFRKSLHPHKYFREQYNHYTIVAYAFVIILPSGIIIYNFINNKPKKQEIIIRLLMTLWFVIWSLLLYITMDNVHLHHRLFSFIFCLWSYQEKLIIQILFFVSLGIFIQGSMIYPYVGLISS